MLQTGWGIYLRRSRRIRRKRIPRRASVAFRPKTRSGEKTYEFSVPIIAGHSSLGSPEDIVRARREDEERSSFYAERRFVNDNSTTSMSEQDERVPLTSLPPQQLVEIKNGLEGEIQSYGSSISQLQQALSRYMQSKAAIKHLGEAKENDKLMLPLTSSMYVRGRVEDPSRVLIDVGTGFFVKMSTKEGSDVVERKIQYISANVDAMRQELAKKRDMLQQVMDAFRQLQAR